MKFKATSYGVNLGPDGTEKGWGVFGHTEEECTILAEDFLRSLSLKQQETAYVKVIEVKEVLKAEIHTAKEKGPNGEVIFAVARP